MQIATRGGSFILDLKICLLKYGIASKKYVKVIFHYFGKHYATFPLKRHCHPTHARQRQSDSVSSKASIFDPDLQHTYTPLTAIPQCFLLLYSCQQYQALPVMEEHKTSSPVTVLRSSKSLDQSTGA